MPDLHLPGVEVPVRSDDTPRTLAARVFAVETELYPATIRQYMARHPGLKRASCPVPNA